MTREEAIYDLKALKDFFVEQSDASPLCLEYAIEALSKDVVHGNWKEDNNEVVYCSHCLKGFPKNRQAYMNFCSNCGADMRGKEDDN